MSDDATRQNDLINQTILLAADLYAWETGAAARSIAEPSPPGIDPDELKKARELAKQETQKAAVKKVLCAALRSVDNDVRAVARSVATALVPLALTGSKRRVDVIRHLGCCRCSADSWGRRHEQRSFTIELRGANSKEADCIRPTLAASAPGLSYRAAGPSRAGLP
jgi:hypothetical protein